jgi:curved DNA-binding protein CbpA
MSDFSQTVSSLGNQNAYDVLGVSQNATQDEIKKAFRRQAKDWHPDRNPGEPVADQKFKKVQEAYSILEDDGTRRQYDRVAPPRDAAITERYNHNHPDALKPDPRTIIADEAAVKNGPPKPGATAAEVKNFNEANLRQEIRGVSKEGNLVRKTIVTGVGETPAIQMVAPEADLAKIQASLKANGIESEVRYSRSEGRAVLEVRGDDLAKLSKVMPVEINYEKLPTQSNAARTEPRQAPPKLEPRSQAYDQDIIKKAENVRNFQNGNLDLRQVAESVTRETMRVMKTEGTLTARETNAGKAVQFLAPEAELVNLQKTLKMAGIESTIRESGTEGGRRVLQVDGEDYLKIRKVAPVEFGDRPFKDLPKESKTASQAREDQRRAQEEQRQRQQQAEEEQRQKQQAEEEQRRAQDEEKKKGAGSKEEEQKKGQTGQDEEKQRQQEKKRHDRGPRSSNRKINAAIDMMEGRSAYDVLGLDKNASPDEVQKAYRRAAKEHHPDRNPGDPDAPKRFMKAQAAYEVLSDSAMRADYDRMPQSQPLNNQKANGPAAKGAEEKPQGKQGTAADDGPAPKANNPKAGPVPDDGVNPGAKGTGPKAGAGAGAGAGEPPPPTGGTGGQATPGGAQPNKAAIISSRSNIGGGSLGIVFGAKQLSDGIAHGDAGHVTLGTLNLASGGAIVAAEVQAARMGAAGMEGLAAAGASSGSKALGVAGKVAGKAAIPLALLAVGYDTYKEEGTGEDDKVAYKTARAGVGLASIAIGIGAGIAATAAIAGTVLSAGTLGPVLIPLGAGVVAGAGTAIAGNAAIDSHKEGRMEEKEKVAQEERDRINAEKKAQFTGAIDRLDKNKDGKVDMKDLDPKGRGSVSLESYANKDGVFDRKQLEELKKDVAAIGIIADQTKDEGFVKLRDEMTKMTADADVTLTKVEKDLSLKRLDLNRDGKVDIKDFGKNGNGDISRATYVADGAKFDEKSIQVLRDDLRAIEILEKEKPELASLRQIMQNVSRSAETEYARELLDKNRDGKFVSTDDLIVRGDTPDKDNINLKLYENSQGKLDAKSVEAMKKDLAALDVLVKEDSGLARAQDMLKKAVETAETDLAKAAPALPSGQTVNEIANAQTTASGPATAGSVVSPDANNAGMAATTVSAAVGNNGDMQQPSRFTAQDTSTTVAQSVPNAGTAGQSAGRA